MLSRLTLLSALIVATPASAETEAGLIAGYDFMSASSGGPNGFRCGPSGVGRSDMCCVGTAWIGCVNICQAGF